MKRYSYIYVVKVCTLIIAGVLTGLFLSACNEKKQEWETNYAQLLQAADQPGFLARLIELDAKHPGQVNLKTQLGFLLVTMGKIDQARTYIMDAKNLEHKADPATKARIYLNLALLAYQDKAFDKGLTYAGQSLKFVPAFEEAVAAKASCLFQTGKKDEAYTLFEDHWKTGRMKMTRDDLLNYSELLLEKGNYKRELEVLEQYQQSFEYNDGLGFLAARLYGLNGDIERAILASAMDLEFGYANGTETVESISRRLESLEAVIKKEQLDPQDKGSRLLASIKNFYQGDYQQTLAGLKGINIQFPYFHYLLLVSQLETLAAPEPEVWENYKDGEKFFKSFATYYYHYWQGLQKAGSSDPAEVKTIMTRCILAAPGSSFATKTRVELGKLAGLKETESQCILLDEELDAIFANAVKEQNLQLLNPVLELLATPDNVYEEQAVNGLQELALKLPAIGSYLESKESTATGLLQERLRRVLHKKN